MDKLIKKINRTTKPSNVGAVVRMQDVPLSRSARRRRNLVKRGEKIALNQEAKALVPVVKKKLMSKAGPKKNQASLDKAAAERYALSLTAPELMLDADIPDNSPYRNTIVPTRFNIPISVVEDSATNLYYAGGVCLFPRLKGTYFPLSAFHSGTGALTWGSGVDHPAYASLLANFASYQPISMVGKLANLQSDFVSNGLFYANQIFGADSGQVPGDLPDNLTSFTMSPYTQIIPDGELEQHGVRHVWLPPNTATSTLMIPTATTATDMGYIVLLWYGKLTGESQETAILNLDVHLNVSAEADESVAFLFPSRPSVAGNDSVFAGALRQAVSWVDSIGSSISAFDQWLAQNPLVRGVSAGVAAYKGAFAPPALRRSRALNCTKRDRVARKIIALLSDADVREELSDELKIDSSVFGDVLSRKEALFSVEMPRRVLMDHPFDDYVRAGDATSVASSVRTGPSLPQGRKV